MPAVEDGTVDVIMGTPHRWVPPEASTHELTLVRALTRPEYKKTLAKVWAHHYSLKWMRKMKGRKELEFAKGLCALRLPDPSAGYRPHVDEVWVCTLLFKNAGFFLEVCLFSHCDLTRQPLFCRIVREKGS